MNHSLLLNKKNIHQLKRSLMLMPQFFLDLAKEFIDKGCQKNAAALTYMTLFALVPMMTVTYSMFSLVPAFDGVAERLQTLIFEHFLPSTSTNIQGYLSGFSSQARSLTGFGVGMLIVTAYLMLTNIEKTFNMIWGVKQARRGLSSFLLYWAVLSIGPLLLGFGLVLSTYLLSLKITVQQYDQLGVLALVFRYASFLMTAAAFTLLFAAVPNCRVPMRHAVIGGVVTAFLFLMLKIGFANMVSSSSFSLIYGAFAAVPLFLLWINFLWMIVLGGAVFTRSLSENRYGRYQDYSDIRAMLCCLEVFNNKAREGTSVYDKDCISLGVSLFRWQNLRSILVRNKWIVVTDVGAYALIRDLHNTTLWDLALLVGMPVGETFDKLDASVEVVDSVVEAVDSSTQKEGDMTEGGEENQDAGAELSAEKSSRDQTVSSSVLAPSSRWFATFDERKQNVNNFTQKEFDISLYDLFVTKKNV